jgi:hypothetical protein
MDSQHRMPDEVARWPRRARRRLLIGGAGAVALVAAGLAAAAMATAQATTKATTCSLDQLRIILDDGAAVPGAMHHQLRYTNASNRECTLQGYPELDFREANGNPLGAVARKHGQTRDATVTLSPGASAYSSFSVMVVAPDVCRPADAAQIRVRPPVTDPRSATTTIPFHGYVCTNPQTPVAVRPMSPEPDLPSAATLGGSAPTP